MISFTRILCPVDFSDTSQRALTYAIALTKWYDGELEVLHVVPAFDLVPADYDQLARNPDRPSPPVSREDILTELAHAIDAAGAAGLNVRPLAQEGKAHEMIVFRAQAFPADLLVMGTHGRSGFNRLLMGSVTEKVVRTAPCPVLTVPPGAEATSIGQIAFRKILCPVDFSPSAMKALQYALELARQANGTVTVLHALEYMDPYTHEYAGRLAPDRVTVEEADRRKQQVLRQVQEQLHSELAGEPRTWCDIEEVVAVNRAYKEILDRAASARTDLIVMGAQGSGGLELMLFGSNTQHVVRAASCPVLTVRA